MNITDHDLSKLANDWANILPNEDNIGIRTAFARGFRACEEQMPFKLITNEKYKLKKGDVFLWRSGMTGKYEIHTFHSDAGYGVKTFTDYNEKDGSSLLVNWSGVCGVISVS